MQDPTPLIYIFVAGIIIAIIIFIFASRRLKARAQETESFAAHHGFRSEGNVNPFLGMVDRSDGSGMLVDVAAGNGTIRNVLRGATAAGEAILYDYRAPRIDSGPDGSGPPTTVAAFRVAGIPEFQMMPQGRFNFGIKDIDFPSHPVFSKRFLVMSNDEAGVRKLFSSAVLDACQTLSEKRNWSLHAGWGWLFVTFGEARGGDMKELVDQSAHVAAAMQR